jgi:SAM-dependent methyltransferase
MRAIEKLPVYRSLRHQLGFLLGPIGRRFRDRRAIDRVSFGDLRRLQPISRRWGYDRSHPIDRYYIEEFISAHATDIRGHVLEVGSDIYTRQFGGDRVAKSDVLHVVSGNPKATIVGDLACADHIPANQFDCFVLTQTLQMIYDQRAAIRHIYRILKPGGVVLMTSHGISKLDLADEYKDHWHLTSHGARQLFAEVFPADCFDVQAHGNVLVAIAFLHGLGQGELRPEELDYFDAAYEVLITVRAMKNGDKSA